MPGKEDRGKEIDEEDLNCRNCYETNPTAGVQKWHLVWQLNMISGHDGNKMIFQSCRSSMYCMKRCHLLLKLRVGRCHAGSQEIHSRPKEWHNVCQEPSQGKHERDDESWWRTSHANQVLELCVCAVMGRNNCEQGTPSRS